MIYLLPVGKGSIVSSLELLTKLSFLLSKHLGVGVLHHVVKACLTTEVLCPPSFRGTIMVDALKSNHNAEERQAPDP